MLESLHIRDFAIVKSLELAFERGLTVLTGETGAGKSILIDALALALGGRADVGVIRHGCARAEVAAGFALAPNGDAARWLAEHDLASDGECLLRRVVESERGSKGFINGRPVPIQMLRELGERLVDIHGQHEHQSLLRRDAQRDILDDYAGLGAAVADVAARYDELMALTARRDALTQRSADRGARLELLQHQVQELDALKLTRDEIPGLDEEHARLANGAQLIEGVQTAAQALYDDDEHALATQLARITTRLESLSHVDARLGEIGTLLSEAGIQIEEAAGRLHSYLDALELDPERLQWLEHRIGAVHDLARKHRVRPEELPATLERLRTELNDVEDFDANLARLEAGLAQARAGYMTAAAAVSGKRAAAAHEFGREVSRRVQQLGMPDGCFEIALAPPRPMNSGAKSAGGCNNSECRTGASRSR